MTKKKVKKKKLKGRGGSKYLLNREKLLRLYIARRTAQSVSEELNISKKTADRWINRLVDEEGTLTDKRISVLKKDYVTKSQHDLELATKVLINDIISSVEPVDRHRAARAMAFLKKVGLDIFTRFKIVDPETVNIEGSSVKLEFIGLVDDYPSVKRLRK